MKPLLQIKLLTGFLFLSIIALAQPTLTQSNSAPVAGQKFIYHVSTFVSPGSAGASQTWDLSAMTDSTRDTTTMVTVASTPYASSFSNATVSGKSGSGSSVPNYGYYKISSTVYQSYGAVSPSAVVMAYTNPEDILRFPFTYGGSYTDPWAGTFPSGGYTDYRSGNTTVTADGYGTLKLPGKTYANVLRVHMVENYQDSLNFGGSPFVLPYQNDEYMWYLPGNGQPIAAVYTLTVDYTSSTSKGLYLNTIVSGIDEAQSAISSFSIYPNPANTCVHLDLTLRENKSALVSVVNVLGAEVRGAAMLNGKEGSNLSELNVSDLPAGIYFARVMFEDNSVETKRFIVAR